MQVRTGLNRPVPISGSLHMSKSTQSWKPAMRGLLFAALAGSIGSAWAQAAPEPPANTRPIIGTITPDPNRWGEIGFVNVAKFPFDGTPTSAVPKAPLGPTSKTIFQSPEAGPGSALPVGQLIHLEYLPTFSTDLPPPGKVAHYHEFHEWGYTLRGDSIMPEPVHPDQMNGMNFRKKEGGWLTRPPYS